MLRLYVKTQVRNQTPYEMPLLNPFSLSLFVLALANLAFFTTVALLG